MLPSKYVEQGWTQNIPYRYTAEEGKLQVCAFEGIERSVRDVTITVEQKLQYAFMLRRIIKHDKISKWNDLPGTTKGEVVEKMREVEREMGLVPNKERCHV